MAASLQLVSKIRTMPCVILFCRNKTIPIAVTLNRVDNYTVRNQDDRMLASLRYPEFRLLWMASLSAGGASWALIVTRGWLVYSLQGNSIWVGVVTFAAMIPMFLAPPIVGILADKFDRRKLLAVLFLLQFAHNVALAGLVGFGIIEIWHVVVLSFVNGFTRASELPVAQSLFPALVPHSELVNAVSLNAATMHGSRLVGPALIAPLMVWVGVEGALIACTCFYVLSFVLVQRIRTVSIGIVDETRTAYQNFLVGVNFIYRHSVLLPLAITVFLHCCLTMSFESLLPVVAERLFPQGAVGTTYLMMAVGAGALVFVLSTAGIKNETVRGRGFLLMAIISGLSPAILGISDSNNLALIGCCLMGGSQAAYMAISNAVVQLETPDGIRGRVLSVYFWHIGGMMAVLNLGNAAVSDRIGIGWVLSVEGASFLVFLGLSLSITSLRRLYGFGTAANRLRRGKILR